MARAVKSAIDGWNDALPEEGRRIVEECFGRILPQNWRTRKEVIETAIATVTAPRGAEVREFIAGAVVAAIIERLDTPPIVEADQAQLFAKSANLDHQLAACDWFINQCTPEVLSPAAGLPARLH